MDSTCCPQKYKPNTSNDCSRCDRNRYPIPENNSCKKTTFNCDDFVKTPYGQKKKECSGHLNYLDKKKLCCQYQCSHREEKLTGYKTIPYALPIPNYAGHRPMFPHPLPPNPEEFMGCHHYPEDP